MKTLSLAMTTPIVGVYCFYFSLDVNTSFEILNRLLAASLFIVMCLGREWVTLKYEFHPRNSTKKPHFIKTTIIIITEIAMNKKFIRKS